MFTYNSTVDHKSRYYKGEEMQKVRTYTKFKIDEKTYRWRDDNGYWYIYCSSVIQMGFREVPRSENDLLEQQYQELIVDVPDYEKLHSKAIEQLQSSNQTLKDAITIIEQNYRKGYQQGYNAAMENIKGEFDIALTHLFQFRDNQLNDWRHEQTLGKVCEPPEYSYAYVGSGKDCMAVANDDETLAEATRTDQDKTASDVYLNTPWIHPVNGTEEPTRPSEEDMINKPSVNTDPGRAYTEGVGYEQGRVVKRRHQIGNVAVEETFEPNYDQHPQFRDIGIRIDRYGKLVFKPELTDAKN